MGFLLSMEKRFGFIHALRAFFVGFAQGLERSIRLCFFLGLLLNLSLNQMTRCLLGSQACLDFFEVLSMSGLVLAQVVKCYVELLLLLGPELSLFLSYSNSFFVDGNASFDLFNALQVFFFSLS